MSEKTQEKGARSVSKQMRRSVKGLEQVASVLRQLSGISLILNKNLRRSGKHLRSVLDFDRINRLNAPLKGEQKSSARRRRGRRRSGTRRRSAGRRRTAGRRWNAGRALRGLRGLGRLLGEVWKRLRLFLLNRKWSLPKSFTELARGAGKLGEVLRGALSWGYEKVLKPLAQWTLEEAAPAALEALGKALGLLSRAAEVLAPLGQGLWEHFLAPLGSFTGELVVGALKAVGDAFEGLAGGVEALLNFGSGLGAFWDGVREQAEAFFGGLGSSFQFDPRAWLEKQVLGPLSRCEPLLKLKLALTQGPADLWNSFRTMWEQNPAVKTLVELVRSGWSSVADWVKEHLGGGVEKAVSLLRDGWSNVCDWVKGHLGGAVNKGVGLSKSGWSNVCDWVKEHLGGAVSKGVGLSKSGWSNVCDWVKGHLGGAVNKGVGLSRSGWSSVRDWVNDRLGGAAHVSVGLVKGWKGSVVKALGLGKLKTKLNLKLPTVRVSWEGSPIKLPKFSVQWHARGAILNGAQLFGLAGNTLLGGGERGREAVLPLESHTGWMDTLASRVAGQVSAGPTPPIEVKVVLDGRVVAESTVREWRRQARQGRYPLSELV